MQELLGLLLDRADDTWMAVAGGVDGNARHKIKIAVAVHVPYFGAAAVIHDEVGHTPISMRNDSAVAGQQIARLGTWYIEASDGSG